MEERERNPRECHYCLYRDPRKPPSSSSHSGHPEALCGTRRSPPTVGRHLVLEEGYILGLCPWENTFLLIVSCGHGQERNNPNRKNYLQERPYIHCRQAYFTDCFPSVCPQLIFSIHLCSPNLQFTPVYQLPKALSVRDCALHCIVHIYCIGISLSHF